MTNGEKYKTAQERAEAYINYYGYNRRDSLGIIEALFAWLDLEAEEEKPLPCPFCGSEVEAVDFSDFADGGQIVCSDCDYQSRGYLSVSDAIAAHNRVAKAVMEGKAK